MDIPQIKYMWLIKAHEWPGEMAQWSGALAALVEDLGSIPRAL